MDDATLVIKRTLNATPEEVFNAWTDPKEIVKWYGPPGITSTIHEMEVKERGVYRLTMKGADGEYPLFGQFKTLDKPHKLVMTWQWEKPMGDDPTKETLVTVDFKEIGGKTEMTLTHSGFASDAERGHHDTGWSGSFDKLEVHLG